MQQFGSSGTDVGASTLSREGWRMYKVGSVVTCPQTFTQLPKNKITRQSLCITQYKEVEADLLPLIGPTPDFQPKTGTHFNESSFVNTI